MRHREAEQLGGVQIDESSNFFDGITGRLTGFLSDAPHPSDHPSLDCRQSEQQDYPEMTGISM